jgi:hypothetical protein
MLNLTETSNTKCHLTKKWLCCPACFCPYTILWEFNYSLQGILPICSFICCASKERWPWIDSAGVCYLWHAHSFLCHYCSDSGVNLIKEQILDDLNRNHSGLKQICFRFWRSMVTRVHWFSASIRDACTSKPHITPTLQTIVIKIPFMKSKE